jgi:MATE family multidrug resistance protein
MTAFHSYPDSLETTKLVPLSYFDILRFTIPLMLGLVTTALMTLIDTIFIGQLGTEQLAAVPLASWVYILGWMLLVGVLENSIAFLARAFGAKEYHKIGHILAHYQVLALLGLPLLYLFIQSWPLFSTIANLEPTVDGYAWVYLKIRVWDATFSLLFILYSTFYQSLGNSLFPMLVAVGILLLNIVLDYGLIFGNLGMPALGVAGSAYATVFSQAFGALFIVAISFLRPISAHYRLRIFTRLDFNLFKNILRIGLPKAIGDCLDLLVWVGLMLIVCQLGTVSLAANNIGILVTEFLFLFGYAIGIAVASYMGRFLGANRSDIARAMTYRTLLLGVTYMGVLGIPLWFFGESIAGWFSVNNAVIYQAGLMFKVIALFQIFSGINIILRSALSGAGDTLIPTLFLMGCAAGIMFPAAMLLSQLIEPGLLGAWLGTFIYMVALSALIMYRYRSNRWTVIFSLAQK